MEAVDAQRVGELRQLAFPERDVEAQDVERWVGEAFSLSSRAGQRFVLEQRLGGPCGVIASVQGFLLVHLLFERGLAERGMAALEELGEEDAAEALAEALASILWRARSRADAVVCTGSVADDSVKREVVQSSDALKTLLTAKLSQFCAPGGVMLFMYSLMLTRSVAQLRDDMDDPTQGLTGKHGHCTQELMNLLLCGVAASQVHDGNADLGGGMVLRGVPERPRVGYLTHLEALRYCEVGTFFKKPIFPVWTVGSDSHYTVLFGFDKSINEESLRTLTLNRAKRAFNEQDREENGFVAIEKLSAVLSKLELQLSEREVADFISQTEMPGSGIILWNNFWARVKPMLMPRSDWNCPACTFANDKNTDLCDMCGTRRKDDMINDTGVEGEDDGAHTFDLVHINGLASTRQGVQQGPRLTQFKLTTVPQDLQAPSTHGLGVPFEEVLHTRWRGSVFAFPGDAAPSING